MARGGGGRSSGGSSGSSGRSSGGSSRSSGGRVSSGSSRSTGSSPSSGTSSGRGGRTSSSSSSSSSKSSSSFFGRGGGGGTSSSSYGGSRGPAPSSSSTSSRSSGPTNQGAWGTGTGYHFGGHHHRPYRPRRRWWFRRNYYDNGLYYNNGPGYGTGYGPAAGRPPGVVSGCIRGCLISILGFFGLLTLCVVIAAIVAIIKGPGQSTGEPVPVKEEASQTVGQNTSGEEITPPLITPVVAEYFTDELGWLSDSESVTQAMQYFAEQTKVKPYLFITDYVNGTYYPTEEDFDIFANELYDSLFDDEDHLLVIYHEYESTVYSLWYVTGLNATEYLGDDEVNILFDSFDNHYYSDLSDDEYFRDVFMEAGEKIAGGS